MATNVIKNHSRALQIRAKTASAAASENPKAALSTLPEVIIFCHTGKGKYIGKLVLFMLYN